MNVKTAEQVNTTMYTLNTRIGSGSFGSVWHATRHSDAREVAIKREHADTKLPQLRYEYRVMTELREASCLCVPRLFGRYVDDQNNECVAMELLGPDLQTLLKKKRLPLKRVTTQIGPRYIRALRDIHNANYLHRDIKPRNLVTTYKGHGYRLIDYGLAKKYRNASGEHTQPQKNKPFVGTPRFASISKHFGFESSRRDDIESLGYTLVYLANGGSLPWQGMPSSTIENIRALGHVKQNTSVDELCKGLPSCYRLYMNHVKGLGFSDRPDYTYLEQLFTTSLDVVVA